MAESTPSLHRTLAALALTAALAGCAATHVGDDWQCPLAQGEVCTSIADADPAVAPDAAPPPLATRTPLYRTSDTQAAAPPPPEAETESGTTSGTQPRPCAEGCNPVAWLGRMLAPRGTGAESAETTEPVSTAPLVEAPAPVEMAARADDAPCGAGAPEPVVAPVDTHHGTEPTDDVDAPCTTATEGQETSAPAPIVAVEPIAPSTAAAIPCETDQTPVAPVESPMEAAATTDATVSDDAETPCADPVSAEEAVASESTETAEAGPAAAQDTPPSTEAGSPSTVTTRLPPPPVPDALRTGEVIGRIWIAPFVDAGGVYREGAWVRAVLAPAGWRR